MLLTLEEEHRLQWEKDAPEIPYGLCQCGCGQPTKIASHNKRADGWVKGCPIRFIHTHFQNAGHRAKAKDYREWWAQEVPEIPYGYCRCGCGEKAPPAGTTNPRRGLVKGEPQHYVRNHHRRKSGIAFIQEDRGFDTPCWIWQRRIDKKGYAITYVDGAPVFAHRRYYEEQYGSLPEDYDAHHMCEVKCCVNYDHILPLEHAEHSRLSQETYWQRRKDGVGTVEIKDSAGPITQLPSTGPGQ